ncbi:DUF1501 domain-containing protein [Cognatishimia sp. F0-27]|uniref:DUF1501 domain-containing protein n=1 Tax=Cognatishimia sp. F0-27 TaxID=2816855 RepID=UPI001D0C5957|nr:DUF1501 domain-containing protein [Cognatishimia sp. F0-27]MCC1494238.1 DUF1501 domain-containing protein [Cognatishimia sp. F0-27]
MDRRGFLGGSLALGCSLAASPLVTPITFAATPGEARLVVIILRGAMDGLAAVAPYGDRDFASLRGALPIGGDGYRDLDGFYALAPELAPLMPLWQAGQLSVVHAVSTPYRNKRSHFDGQDMLEAGISDLGAGLTRDGWLNRMLGLMAQGGQTQTAYAVGHDALKILRGDAPVERWSPDADLLLSPQAVRLARMVMEDDPAMARALDEALRLAGSDGDGVMLDQPAMGFDSMMQGEAVDTRPSAQHRRLAGFVADRLRADARVASFSLNGWDTHRNQAAGLGRALTRLSETILTLREETGPAVWDQTTVVAMTEFGRTARFNGGKGTDHGTGGAMILAGGALNGGRVVADWPGLSEADLFERRDLMPTRDLRAHAGWLVHGLFGLSRSDVETGVFPGVDLGADPRHLG